jgi:tetratricopeptide (TPR) repeat protein
MQKHTLLQGLQAMPGDGALLVALGSVLEQDEDWTTLRDVLLDHWPRMPSGSPQEGHVIYLIAKACLELSDWPQAVRLASRAAHLLPGFPYVHHILGRALARLGRLQEALEAQYRCSELEPTFAWCWFEIGAIALDLGDPAASRSAFQRALSLQQVDDPDSTAIIRHELLRAEQSCLWEEREAAARHLWPDRPVLQPNAHLPVLERLALMTEEFRLFLDKVEAQTKPKRP